MTSLGDKLLFEDLFVGGDAHIAPGGFATQKHLAEGNKIIISCGKPENEDIFRWADVGIGPYGVV